LSRFTSQGHKDPSGRIGVQGRRTCTKKVKRVRMKTHRPIKRTGELRTDVDNLSPQGAPNRHPAEPQQEKEAREPIV